MKLQLDRAGQKMNEPERRLDFGHFVDRIFWALLTSAALYSASQLRQLGDSVSDLNSKMAVVLDKLIYTEKRADAQDKRIDRLEDLLRAHHLK